MARLAKQIPARGSRDDESGAVTVDWVVLTAAVIGLGFAVTRSIIAGATNDSARGVGAHLSACRRSPERSHCWD